MKAAFLTFFAIGGFIASAIANPIAVSNSVAEKRQDDDLAKLGATLEGLLGDILKQTAIINSTLEAVPEGREADDIKPYVTCSLVHPDDINGKNQKSKTQHYRQHKLGFLRRGENPPPTDPIWDDKLEWEYDDNELVFLRIFIKDDISFAENPIYAVTAVRLLYVVSGWCFIRLLDLKGHETTCSLLVKFEFEYI
ncbi:hypothetical protein NUW58_g1104 [Xylaria curta]|uniref:Uncharacterized protein n=1 Tax=Xylaria curta TaxID=42375 RepID=A0ACC1PP97_9PEZI|nr:hypothetical protein NUW58_g1104 [Xylaria curta]